MCPVSYFASASRSLCCVLLRFCSTFRGFLTTSIIHVREKSCALICRLFYQGMDYRLALFILRSPLTFEKRKLSHCIVSDKISCVLEKFVL